MNKTIIVLALGHSLCSLGSSFNCGDTISTGDLVKLTSDVGPCDDNTEPALTVVAPTTLDLNGFKVYCQDLDSDKVVPNGILLVGNGAILKNGTVEGCVDNVQLGNEFSPTTDGNHIVSDIVSKSTGFDAAGDGGDCFDLAVNNNTLKNFEGLDCSDDGLDLDSSGNKIINGSLRNVGDNGISVNGTENLIKWLELSNIADRGIDLDGDSNYVLYNKVVESGKEGIRADDGSSNLIAYNSVTNGQDTGISLESQDNLVRANEVKNNVGDGIKISSGAINNEVKFNFSIGNQIDFKDENLDCSANLLEWNLFGTSEFACVE